METNGQIARGTDPNLWWLLVITLLLIIWALSSCTKDDDGFTIYTVPAGKHYSRHTPKRTLGKHSLQAWFKINETWDMGYTGGTNKILGISDGLHKKNSCRIGFQCRGVGVFEIHQYTYADGVRSDVVIDTVTYGTYYVDMGHCGDVWRLHFNGGVYESPAGKKVDMGAVLFPYIGGEGTIDHDFVVAIKFR